MSSDYPLATRVEQFQARTLPHEQWNHEAHLCIALWTLHHFEWDEAIFRLRQEISSYNESIGVHNGPFSGYHETITHFFARAVQHFLRQHPEEEDLEKLWPALISQWGDKNLVLRYYSKRYLFSPATRAQFAPPDLRPFDF
jgi:hypothetical protein